MTNNEELLASIHSLLVRLSEEVAVLKNIVEGFDGKHKELQGEFRRYRDKNDEKMVDLGKQISRLRTERQVDKAAWKGPRTVITVMSAIIAMAAGTAVFWDKVFGG